MLESNCNFFVVDDHQLIVDGILGMLKDEVNFSFLGSANEGFTAEEKLMDLGANLDLLITDINMSGQTGIDLCKKMKAVFPSVKVLIISMYQNNTVIREAMMAEADGYILKTSGKKDFLIAIERIMEGGSYYSEAILPIIYQEFKKEQEKVDALAQLTSRELDVLKLIVQEMTSEDIAKVLFISKKTVDNHRQNLLVKTGSKSSIGLVKFAIKAGLEIQ
jgi:two-component system, NarL family, nitrate/nitrite response regulator NarL